jgi:hypothetical protein
MSATDESESSLLKSNRGGFVVLFDPSWRPASVAGFACLSHAYIDAARGQDELLIFGRFDGHLEEFADIAGKYGMQVVPRKDVLARARQWNVKSIKSV